MITPKQIKDELASRPPLQLEEAASHYKGIPVSWELGFRQVFYPDSNNKSTLTVHAMSGGADVAFQVNPNEYPKLKVLHRGERIWVDGQISEIQSGYLIVLNPVKLRFEQTPEVKQPSSVIHNHSVTVNGDFVQHDKYEQNGDQNKIEVNQSSIQKRWYEKWWGIIAIGVIVGLSVAIITKVLNLNH